MRVSKMACVGLCLVIHICAEEVKAERERTCEAGESCESIRGVSALQFKALKEKRNIPEERDDEGDNEASYVQSDVVIKITEDIKEADATRGTVRERPFLLKHPQTADQHNGPAIDKDEVNAQAPLLAPDRVLTQEEIETVTLVLDRFAESPDSEAELEMLLKTLIDIEKPASHPALLSSNATGETINIYMDGITPAPVPRDVTDSFVQEILYSFPIEDSTVNATHVFLAFGSSLQGEFVRDTKVRNMFEYGKIEQRWGENPMSSFPNVIVGAAEKFVTLSHDGAWPTTSLDRARAEQASRSSWAKWTARKMRRAKTSAIFLYLLKSRLGPMLVDASLDPNHLAKVVEFTRENGGQPEPSWVHSEHALMQRLAQKSLNSASAAPSSSSNACFHLPADSSIQVTPTGVFVPLGRKLSSYKGEMGFSPLQYYDTISGVSTWTYDSNQGVLTIYMGASSLMHIADPQELVQNPKLFVGPADGASFIVAEEGRIQRAPPGWSAYALYHAGHRIPVDYDYLFTDPQELCPSDKLNQLAEEAKDLDLMVFSERAKLPSQRQQVQLVRHLLDVIDCGTPWLRAVQQNGNGVGLLEMTVFMHFMVESTPKWRLQNVHGWSNGEVVPKTNQKGFRRGRLSEKPF